MDAVPSHFRDPTESAPPVNMSEDELQGTSHGLMHYYMRSFVDLTQHLAIEESWNGPFKGSLDQLLVGCLRSYAMQEEGIPYGYGHSVAVINSSGTGKTRTVDQVGLKIPLVPICLAAPSATSQFI